MIDETLAIGAVLAVLACLPSCMLGTQFFNSHDVTKKSDGAYNDMNPLGISGCKAKKLSPQQYEVYCRCGGGGSTEGCLDTERESVDKGFDEYAHRVCVAEGFRDHQVEKKDHPPAPAGEEGDTKAAIATGTIRCE